jgi:hypothetical protein
MFIGVIGLKGEPFLPLVAQMELRRPADRVGIGRFAVGSISGMARVQSPIRVVVDKLLAVISIALIQGQAERVDVISIKRPDPIARRNRCKYCRWPVWVEERSHRPEV